MRKSVLTGILACTLVFSMSTLRAAAAENLTDENQKTVVQLLASADNKNALEVIENVTLPQNGSESTSEVSEQVQKHVVTENETLTQIAEIYHTTWQRLFDKNAQVADPNIINAGMELVIPTETEQLTHREIVQPVITKKAVIASETKNVAKKTQTTVASTPRPAPVAGNKYSVGYCTWYVKNRRPDLPNNLGNAISWVSRAASQGYATGSTPKAGAVGQRGNHVVYVEAVNDDGTVSISEMNHEGWNVTSRRTVAANYLTYIY